MIVFDLRCDQAHVFEAWFGSSADYADQQARGLLACPVCGSVEIDKAVMAPNVAPKGNRAQSVAPMQSPPSPEAIKAALAHIAAAQAKALEQSTWVGRAFVDRARAMHLGDEDKAPIHGQASVAEAAELAEEGVPIAPLLLPVVPPETCH
jgi:hypothetical protein